MGNFNLSTPSVRGMEWRPKQIRQVLLDAPGRGLMMRYTDESLTLDSLDVYFSRAVGAPGFGFEILTSGDPVVLQTAQYAPTTDTGKNTTGWEDQGGGAANFGELSDGSSSTYHRNTSVVPAGVPIYDEFRLGGVVTTSGQRFARVRVYADVAATAGIPILRGSLNIGGVRYFSGAVPVLPSAPLRIERMFFDFPYNPATLLPWTAADIEAFDSGTDEFGIEMQGVYSSVQPAQTFRLHEMGLELTSVVGGDNREFYAYGTSIGGALAYGGWIEKALTLRAAGTAGAPRWVHLFNWYKADAANYLVVPVLRDANYPAERKLSSTSYVPDRNVWESQVGSCGVVLDTIVRQGEMLPVLFHTTGSPSIALASNPYADARPLTFPELTSFLASTVGQEITTAASTAYAGIMLGSIGWYDPSRAPDGPLLVEVRTGSGAPTGGGTLVASAVVRPNDGGLTDGQGHDVFARFLDPTTGQPTTVTLAATTKHYVLISTTASAGRGWNVTVLDTRSDLLSTGISAAEVEGAGVGGQTDSYFIGNTELDRYDLALAFVAPPTAPSGLSASLTAEVCEVSPNRVRLSWTATSLTTAFGGYNVYRRPMRAAAATPELIGAIRVLTGESATRVEAQHTRFDDWTAGLSLAGGEWEYGYEYAVTVINGTSNVESLFSSWVGPIAPAPTAATKWWATQNERPYLNAFVPAVRSFTGGDQQRLKRDNAAGRDLQRVRSQIELPGREYKVTLDEFSGLGEDPLRVFRLLAAAGLETTLIGPKGQRYVGVLDALGGIDHAAGGEQVSAEFPFVVTRFDSPTADYNLPAGLVLNGSSQFLRVSTDSRLNPGSGDFTVIVAAVFAGQGSSKYALSKGNLGSAAGYGLRTTGTANELQFFVQGASSSGGPAEASATWFDGYVHVAGGGYTSGSVDLYRDGVQVAQSSLAAGAITNSVNLVLGANNNGGSAFMALAPGVAFAVFLRKLTAVEQLAGANYLRGIYGYRMPARASLFVDLRDDRTWKTGLETTARDISGNELHASVVASPSLRGRPWPLVDLDHS